METKWMGRYRRLIAELVRHSNITGKAMAVKNEMGGIMMTTLEWQILEYIVEHRYDDDRMIHISETLEIPQSSFSRSVKMLCSAGLVEKYQMTNNKKNIILKPTERGIELYKTAFSQIAPTGFDQFFKELDALSDEDLEIVIHALSVFNENLKNDFRTRDTETRLIKLE